jgi:peptide deformylase
MSLLRRQVPGDDRRVRVQGEPVDYFPPLPPEVRRGSVHRVTEVGEDVLHRPCREVTDVGTPDLARLVDDLFATMHVAEGAGLAANQIGIDLRVFVWDCPDDDGIRHVGHIVNPVLTVTPPDDRSLQSYEGCLSVPGASAPLPRAARATVRGRDRDGRLLTIEGTGHFARCLQHETDHLDGTLYLDRLDEVERQAALDEMAEVRDAVLARRQERADALASGSPIIDR